MTLNPRSAGGEGSREAKKDASRPLACTVGAGNVENQGECHQVQSWSL